MTDSLGSAKAVDKVHNIDDAVKQLSVVNSFENASKVLSSCAHNAKLWCAGTGTIASVNLLAGRYNCTTSEISSIVYALVQLRDLVNKNQLDEDEIERRLVIHGFADDITHMITSFACNQQLLESLPFFRIPAVVFSPYPRFRSLVARTEIKIGGMALRNAPDVNICIYLGTGDGEDEQALLLDTTMLSEIIVQLEYLILNLCKLERLSIK